MLYSVPEPDGAPESPAQEGLSVQEVLKVRVAVVLSLAGQQKPLAGAVWFRAGLDKSAELVAAEVSGEAGGVECV